MLYFTYVGTKHNIEIFSTENLLVSSIESIERKGLGHPDTLADDLAESLSRAYSNYTKSKFGIVLHHNFDKVGLLGGKSFVAFGKGYLTSPIRVLINGRVSIAFASKKIPYKKIIDKTVLEFFQNRFPGYLSKRDLEIHYNLSNASSPGKTEEKSTKEGTRKYWFEPRGPQDIQELKQLVSNDTSLGCGYSPLSKFEKLVLEIEYLLNSLTYKRENPWCGSDIKIMALRLSRIIAITICVPQIAKYVRSLEEYKNNLERVRKDITKLIRSEFKNHKFTLDINTRDNFDTSELYLTAIGSSIESGDEGLVGRGNRVNGLITPNRPMSMEGVAGKNPVYHVGKLYNIAAFRIAEKIYEITNSYVEVFLISQSGQDLLNPWKTIIKINKNNISQAKIKSAVTLELNKITQITEDLLKGKIKLD